jgi:tetratricopeptide (TPR) repeat protein
MRFLPAGLLVVLLAVPHPASTVRAAPGERGSPDCADGADPPAAKEKPPTIDELVEDLGSPVFAAREKAQRELWKRGEEAVPALEKAAKGDDPEAARRARELLDKFAWGILPDTPPAVLKLIRQFQAGDPNPDRADTVRKEAIGELLKHGRAGVSVVRAILRKDIPPESRTRIIASVTAMVRREVPLLLVANKTAEADELISLHAVGTTTEGAADYAAYHVLRGDLPAALAHVEGLVKSGRRTDAAKLVLVYLYRAAGQWAKARDLAEDLPTEPEATTFKEILLEEEGNWAALADLTPNREFNHPDAVRLTLMRLAGRKEKFEAEAKKVRADAEELNDPDDVMSAAVALLTNHHAIGANDLLLEKKKNLGLLSEILISRMRYKEALDLIGGGAKEKETIPPAERLEFNLRRARVLMTLGKKDQAVQLFEEVVGGLVRPDPERGRAGFSRLARQLIRTEVRVGLRDLACEHAARFVPDGDETTLGGSQGESPFELLFPNDTMAAETLFLVLRAKKIPGDQPGASMIRTRDLLNGAAGAAAVDQAVTALREAAANAGGARLVKARRYFALGLVCRAAKRGDDAEGGFKVAAELTAGAEDAADALGARSWVYGAPDPARVWIEWGEHLADVGRYREAAAIFEAGWKLYPDQPLPMFLWGQALVSAGDAKEGQRRLELAHWVSLGSEKVRGRFLDELVRRGEGKAIKREVVLISKACWSHSHMFGNVMNQCARGSALVQDFATAEVCGQRSLLVVMRKPGVYFVDMAGYLHVPIEVQLFNARALLQAGKFDESMTAARGVLAVMPGHLEFVTGIVPDLDRRGRKKEANELFDLAWTAYEKVVKDNPESAASHNALAQLAGHCNRNLDDGLKHAKVSVASDGGSLPYREALAEVYFRKGERDEAVKVMQKLFEEQPRNPLYKRQLARYRSAAFDSPWPYTVE